MIEILNPRDDAGRISTLTAPGSGYRFVDGWESAREELLAIDSFDPEARWDWGDADVVANASRFIVYPWRSTMVRLPDREHFHRLRTARNRFLLDDEEQDDWSGALIGVAGLSVGSSVASVCSLTGARRFRLADPDTLGPSNLNRLLGSVCDLGESKVTLAQRRLLETDPYTEVTPFADGYTEGMSEAFLGGGRTERLAVLMEEMDNLAMKVAIRLQARERGIPVIMATDNGDNVILDVERYDLEPDYELFHGRAGELSAMANEELNAPTRRLQIANAIVGSEVTPRTRFSLTQVGVRLPSWPQLGTAATVAGSIAALAARLLVCGADLHSGRYRVDLDQILLGESSRLATRWNELDEDEFMDIISRR